MTSECLFVLAPLTLPYYYDFSTAMVSIFLSISALLVLPMSFFINHYSKFMQDRYIIKNLILTACIACLFLIKFSDKFLWNLGPIQYFVAFNILFICSNILESVDSALLAKIMPLHSNLKKIFNPGFTIIITTTFGRFIGAFLVTIFGYFGYEYIENITFTFFLICYAIAYTLILKYYRHLRVKAIARIIKKR